MKKWLMTRSSRANGAGWAMLLCKSIGGLLAVPFLLWDFTLKVLDNLAKLAPDDERRSPIRRNRRAGINVRSDCL